jgi:hypothetical protein
MENNWSLQHKEDLELSEWRERVMQLQRMDQRRDNGWLEMNDNWK